MERENYEKRIHKKGGRAYAIPNPLSHQIITYITVLSFCCITILSCIWMVTLIKTEGLVAVGGIPVITFFAGYASYVGLLVLRYRTAQVTYHKNGFIILKRGNTSSYSWSEIKKTKYHGMLRVLRLHNANGKNIYTIHGITRDNKKFIQEVNEIIGFSTDVF
ncbi:hypothetical protein [Aquimarina sp. MMG016]|uniref:hypothetical protein n=1 Tax=Aquimarina sp. MMG016 TaxID=2822690 RepID=UPI001B39F1BC|nr:hypothetical protein [Aquimarina sp. MMG016]MBQ4820761.1 hypothetical protein [Aquimarina sp. MMG016]